MKIGELDQRITIERPGSAVDNGYTTTREWEAVATVWAKYSPGTGSERSEQARQGAEMVETFRIRWSPDVAGIDPTHRVLFKGRACYVVSAAEVQRRAVIEIKTIARTDGGS